MQIPFYFRLSADAVGMSSTEGLAESRQSDIDTFLDERLVEWNVPGACVAVFDTEGVLYENAYGARSLDPVEPATADSLLHVASITKSYTAIALLQFVEHGDLTLGDPVTDYIEFFADVPGEPITVEELLTHTSGVPSELGGTGGRMGNRMDMVRRYNRWTEDRLSDRKRLMYLNRGYVVLGALIESLANRPYAEHVEDAVLAPMGMERSTFDQDAIEDAERAMRGYVTDQDDDPEPAELDTGEYPAVREGLYGVGGLISTVTDMAAIGPFLLNGGAVGQEQILDPSSVETMCTPQSPPTPTIDGYDIHMSYGFLVEDLLDDTLVYGGGGVPGYGTFVGVLRERGFGVAIGFNSNDILKNDIGKGVLALAAGDDPFQTVRWFRAQRAVDAVSGIYDAPRTGTTATVEPAGSSDLSTLRSKIEVTVEDLDLSFRAAPIGSQADDYTFSSVMGNGHRWTVEFVETEGDRVMLWSAGHRKMRFDKR